ncbi:Na+/H+ antiporter subunit E [Protofrankia coriariae]|uniref:Na+/H+ antiporter subunit E n=1 Tax=Protofrankia coriariae TaxID=1562887 RepID=UPI000B0265F2|nr:Na+/H+ antiporter subunit E [Protofrankia coriariae]
MTGHTAPEPVELARRARPRDLYTRVLRRPGRLGWLWAVWMLLWGRLTPLATLSGLLVAAAILLVFPVRPIDLARRFRPLAALKLLGYPVADIVPSAVAVAWQMIRNGPWTRSAIVAVPLGSSSELLSTLTANAVSLAPGAFVLEIDHEAEALYVYALAAGDAQAAERIRMDVLDLERRVFAVFGADEGVRAAGATRTARDGFQRGGVAGTAEKNEANGVNGRKSMNGTDREERR